MISNVSCSLFKKNLNVKGKFSSKWELKKPKNENRTPLPHIQNEKNWKKLIEIRKQIIWTSEILNCLDIIRMVDDMLLVSDFFL